MGTFASGGVDIFFESVEDATKAHEILSNENVKDEFIKYLGDEGNGEYTFYNFEDKGSEVVTFEVCSDRVQNAEWQVDNLIKLLKHLVKAKVIEAIDDFQAELLTQHSSWSMSADEFFDEEDEEGYQG